MLSLCRPIRPVQKLQLDLCFSKCSENLYFKPKQMLVKVFLTVFLNQPPSWPKISTFFKMLENRGAPSKGIISKTVFGMRTIILQREFDINTMEFGLEVGTRLGSTGRGKKGAIERNVSNPRSLNHLTDFNKLYTKC